MWHAMFPDGLKNWNMSLGSACAAAGKTMGDASVIDAHKVTAAALSVFICDMR
jgi:hypothetical protein